MLQQQALPAAPNDARCPQCSLINACLPGVVADAAYLRGLQGALFTIYPSSDTHTTSSTTHLPGLDDTPPNAFDE
jgi:hypothetical protein